MSEKLTVKDAIAIAKIIMAAKNDRLPIIREIFSMAGLDIETLGSIDEFGYIAGREAINRLRDFIGGITSGKEPQNGEYRFIAPYFTELCGKEGLNDKEVRMQLAVIGAIRRPTTAGDRMSTTCVVRQSGQATRCVCIYQDWENRFLRYEEGLRDGQ